LKTPTGGWLAVTPFSFSINVKPTKTREQRLGMHVAI
jgi:hypothetical protein